MEQDKMEKLLLEQWKSAVKSRRSPNFLERHDLQQVIESNCWDDLEDQLGRSDEEVLDQIAMLRPSLIQMKVFVESWFSQVSPRIDTSSIWGFITFIIQLLQEEMTAAPKVVRMLKELFEKIELINKAFDSAQSFVLDLKGVCVDSSVTLLNFLSDIVVFMRKEMPIVVSSTGWNPLEDKFSLTIRRINDICLRSERLSETVNRQADRDTANARKQDDSVSISGLSKGIAQSSLHDDDATLPCRVFPDIRTSRFFDRTDVIEKMENYFSKVDLRTSFCSLAIFGLGGIGKSTIALKYCEAKLQNNELDALLWVNAEKPVSLRQSFTKIALRLKLPGARQEDDEENRSLVLNWLEHTKCRWLIVYDNAENPDQIRNYWPLAGRNHALITTRNRDFSFQFADFGMEITNWDRDMGVKFLMHLLISDINVDLSASNEQSSALQLSEKLSGHALAISTMAGVIYRRGLSITEFLALYNQNTSELHEVKGMLGNPSINAIWKLSFQTLDDKSRAILSVMSYAEPDSIPQSLFDTCPPERLPPPLKFCAVPFEFSTAIEHLLTQGLITRNSSSRTLALHRLVQTTFKHFMSPTERQEAFNHTTVLVSNAFPRRDSSVAQLYLMWEKCALYLQHVISLRDCFREEQQANPDFKVLQTFCDLNNACQRYLLEINAYTDLEELIEVNSAALKTLPKEQQNIMIQGSLTSHKGQLLVRLGHGDEGVKWLRKSYEIRSHDKPFNPRESAWAAENAATGIATQNMFDEALEWYSKARDHFKEWSRENTESADEWPPALKNSMSRGLTWSGNLTEARALMIDALNQVETTEPYNWAVAAHIHFGLGTVDRFDHNFEQAESHFMEAQNLWFKGDQMRSDPFNGACMYRLGCVALDRGHLEASVKHLRDALVITEKHKDKMVAEHMRCLFKLSEALEQEPREALEARMKREESGQLLKIRAPDIVDLGKESTYDSLVFIYWR